MIGEGANDVLRVFVALVGMRDVGLELKGVLDAVKSPLATSASSAASPAARSSRCSARPRSTCSTRELEPTRMRLGKLVGTFGSQVEAVLRHYQESILDRQYQLARIADSANELYVSACVLRRLDKLLGHGPLDAAQAGAANRPLLPDHRRAAHPPQPRRPVGQRRRRDHDLADACDDADAVEVGRRVHHAASDTRPSTTHKRRARATWRRLSYRPRRPAAVSSCASGSAWFRRAARPRRRVGLVAGAFSAARRPRPASRAVFPGVATLRPWSR